ncbi:MAG: hypothetical protein ACRETA_07460 [Gammaproteobacteria bacterium]
MHAHKNLIPAQVLLLAGLSWLLFAPASAQNIVTGENKIETMQLGKIDVTGQAMILKVLQIIKQGLQEPYSDDPKLANVVVCRLNHETGSHITSTLICATNRIHSEGHDALQLAGETGRARNTQGVCDAMGSACASTQDNQIFDALNESLDALPGHYLHASVNTTVLHALLRDIPVHVPKTPAPTAGTRD